MAEVVFMRYGESFTVDLMQYAVDSCGQAPAVRIIDDPAAPTRGSVTVSGTSLTYTADALDSYFSKVYTDNGMPAEWGCVTYDHVTFALFRAPDWAAGDPQSFIEIHIECPNAT